MQASTGPTRRNENENEKENDAEISDPADYCRLLQIAIGRVQITDFLARHLVFQRLGQRKPHRKKHHEEITLISLIKYEAVSTANNNAIK